MVIGTIQNVARVGVHICSYLNIPSNPVLSHGI
jgi:hypothetical protein